MMIEAVEKASIKRELKANYTLWEEDGTICFHFEENSIIDVHLVLDMFSNYDDLSTKSKLSTLINLEGVLGASFDGLKLLNAKLEEFSCYKAILVDSEKTNIIGNILVNSFKNTVPTKVFTSALQAEFWMN